MSRVQVLLPLFFYTYIYDNYPDGQTSFCPAPAAAIWQLFFLPFFVFQFGEMRARFGHSFRKIIEFAQYASNLQNTPEHKDPRKYWDTRCIVLDSVQCQYFERKRLTRIRFPRKIAGN